MLRHLASKEIYGRLCKVRSLLNAASAVSVRSQTTVGNNNDNKSNIKALKDVGGVYPPITTPFNEKGDIAYDKLEANLQKWMAVPFRGLVLHGTTGEPALLTLQERLDMITYVRKAVPSDKLLIVGTGLESTSNTLSLTKEAAKLGADCVIVITPSYYKNAMSGDNLYQHYVAVADESPVPVLLYNFPGNTGVELPTDIIVRLAQHPNIIGIKESGGDVSKMGYIVHKTKHHGFQVLAGSAGFFLPAMSVGCVGGVFGLANILGEPLCQLRDLYLNNKREEAVLLQHQLIGPNTGVTRIYGVAGVKAAMDWFGYYGGPPRPPLRPLKSDASKHLGQLFADSGFL